MSHNQHILIVDDQMDSLVILEDLLGDRYAVHTANDGEQALEYLEAGGPVDLIVTDVLMPGISGFELCERIKAMPGRQHVPLIFITGLAYEEDREHGLSLGAAGFIYKPFSLQAVFEQVSRHLPAS